MERADERDIKRMILYEDRDILVCHKAAGVPVQSAGVAVKDMESMLLNYLKEKQEAEQKGKGGESRADRPGRQNLPYLGIVHRLDQPVEGILVFAKNKKAAAGLSRQISEGTMKKVYNAVCCVDKVSADGDNGDGFGEEKPGMRAKADREKAAEKAEKKPGTRADQAAKEAEKKPGTRADQAAEKAEKKAGTRAEKEAEEKKKEEILLTDWLKKDARSNTSSIVSPGTPGAKKAELKYRILRRRTIQGKEYAEVRIRLLTGRHHQIRVQMAGAGLPLYGDRKYNPRWEAYRVPEYDGGEGARLALCASELTFRHPVTGKELEFAL